MRLADVQLGSPVEATLRPAGFQRHVDVVAAVNAGLAALATGGR